MYYSENARKKKVKELIDDQEFMAYAKEKFNARVMTWGLDTFEEYLLHDVFELYDNFQMIQFLNTADKGTINKVLNEALRGLDF